MPLLGRHKSLSGGANHNANNNNNNNKQQPALCESPLFGTRRQLPINSPILQQTTSSSSPSSSTSNNKSNHVNNQSVSNSTTSTNLTDQQHKSHANSSIDANQEDAIGSVPQNITRQQIHYAFSIMDTNSDGLIDLRDLSQMLANLGVPIDEAILSHVMSTVSKRGDHLISEAEFLVWIGNFIQVSDEQHQQQQQQTSSSSNKQRRAANKTTASSMVRSSTAGSSLAAHSPEVVPAGANLRQRRGSGSGLALMRSLSSTSTCASSGSTSASSSEQVASDTGGLAGGGGGGGGGAHSNRNKQLADQEARNDLRAAFCVFDLDGDGFITLDEVRAGLKLLGESWTPAELAHLFSQCKGGAGGASGGSSGKAAKAGAKQQKSDLAKQRISIDDFVQLLL